MALIPVDRCDASSLTENLIDLLLKWNLKFENLVGLGTDGASVMCGRNHSVAKLLQDKCPNLLHLKCIAHSIDLVAKHAIKSTMPTCIEHILKECFNHYSHSSVRLANCQGSWILQQPIRVDRVSRGK